jgi:hypothetical protein
MGHYRRREKQMQDNSVFDIIETPDKKYVGVVDYVSTKYISFFDISGIEDPDFRHLVILYKTYYHRMRFSVFNAMYAAQFDFGDPILINKKLIKYHSKPLYATAPYRSVRKVSR